MNHRVAAYLRVSTDNQTHDSQRAELEDYCSRRNWANVQWFVDTASGAKQNRSGLNDLMEQVRRGKIDTLVVFKLDRLARSLAHLAQLIAELQAHGVALVCPSQGIDTTNANPCAQFQLNILAAVAQFERELITERVKAGVSAAKHRGVKLGRPSKWHRYIEPVRTMVFEGLKASEISRKLGIPYSSAGELVREVKTGNSATTGTLPLPLKDEPIPQPVVH